MSAFTYNSSVTTVGKDTDPETVYYNADIIANAQNISSLGIGKDPVVRFSETRSTPILSDSSKYEFSIIRFTMNGSGKDLPMFIPSIDVNQSDINMTTYSVRLNHTIYYVHPTTSANESVTFTAQRYVVFKPEVAGALLPNPPNTVNAQGKKQGQDLRGAYYYVYTYNHWVQLCNNALRDAWNDAELPVPNTPHPTKSIQGQWGDYWTSIGGSSGNQPILQSTPPYLSYNENNGLFTIYGDTYCCGNNPRGGQPPPWSAWSWNNGTPVYADGGATPPTQGTELMRVYFNTNMFGLFANFPNYWKGSEDPLGLTYEILFFNKGTNNVFEPDKFNAFSSTSGQKLAPSAGGVFYWAMEQDYNSTSTLWSPISSIVFTSTVLPIIPEQVGTPIQLGFGNDNASNPSASDFAPIITDIALANNRADDYRGFIAYNPTAEYRMVSLTASKQELRSIDIQVFWKNRLDNRLYPITMFNLSSVSIKIMFRKKRT